MEKVLSPKINSTFTSRKIELLNIVVAASVLAFSHRGFSRYWG